MGEGSVEEVFKCLPYHEVKIMEAMEVVTSEAMGVVTEAVGLAYLSYFRYLALVAAFLVF